MARHRFDDTSLEFPDDFVYSTLIATPIDKDKKDFAPNLVLTRDRLRPNETAETYVARQPVDLAKHLKRFKLRGRRELEIGGHPAQEVSCAWEGAQGQIEQRMTMVFKGGRAITFTASVQK